MSWSAIIASLQQPLRRVHVRNAVEVVLVRVPVTRPRRPAQRLHACAWCAEQVFSLAQLQSVEGDRVCGRCFRRAAGVEAAHV